MNLTFGGLSAGGVLEYRDFGGSHNNAWIGGVGYTVDAWKFGAQFSHGWYDGTAGFSGGFGTDGHKTLNHAIVTPGYALAPGISLDASLGYTWYHDTRSATPDDKDHYHAFSAAIGSAITF